MSINQTVSAFQKRLTILCVICTVIVPLINNFGLSLVLSTISGDIMYETPAEILSYFVSALDTVNMFFVFAVLINSITRFGLGKSKNIIALCVLRIIIVYASYLAMGAIITTNLANTLKGNLYYFVTNAVIDIMLLIGAIVLIIFIRAKFVDENNTNITVKKIFDLKNPLVSITLWITVLISAFLLSGCVINTISDISAYGADNLNAYEIIYLVIPYIKWLLKNIAGYLIMIFCAKLFDTQWKTLYKANSK